MPFKKVSGPVKVGERLTHSLGAGTLDLKAQFDRIRQDYDAQLIGRMRDLYFHRRGEPSQVSFYISRLILDDMGAVNFNIVGEPTRAFRSLNTISETLQDVLSGVYTPV